MACRIGIILYAIVQMIAFVFILVGTPIDMYRAKGDSVTENTACVTMWGTKSKCYSTKYDTRPKDMFASCSGRADRFRAAEAFAIINIFVYGAAFIMGFVLLCCCRCFRWICLVLNIVGLTSIVSWAIVANAYSSSSTSGVLNVAVGFCVKFSSLFNYGAGFALIVTAWCLNLVDIVFLMLPC